MCHAGSFASFSMRIMARRIVVATRCSSFAVRASGKSGEQYRGRHRSAGSKGICASAGLECREHVAQRIGHVHMRADLSVFSFPSNWRSTPRLAGELRSVESLGLLPRSDRRKLQPLASFWSGLAVISPSSTAEYEDAR